MQKPFFGLVSFFIGLFVIIGDVIVVVVAGARQTIFLPPLSIL
jgi:hypothetical protein